MNNELRGVHFELIEYDKELAWKTTGSTGTPGGGSIRKNPAEYFYRATEAEGTLPEIVERAIMDRVELLPDIDIKRGDSFRLRAYLDDKDLGYANKYQSTLRTNFKYDIKEELKKFKDWRKPLGLPKDEPPRVEYKLRIM